MDAWFYLCFVFVLYVWCVCVCAHARYLPLSFSTSFFRESLSLHLMLAILVRLSGPTSPQELPELQASAAMPCFHIDTEDPTLVVMMTQQTFYPVTHLPSSEPGMFNKKQAVLTQKHWSGSGNKFIKCQLRSVVLQVD